jgi:toxin ParE1/3/4
LASSYIRSRARRDILESAAYLGTQSGPELFYRFVDAVEATIENLKQTPRMGAPCDFTHPALSNVRRWPVKGFENWLIFYIARKDGVEIIRVFHGARDIRALFDKPEE